MTGSPIRSPSASRPARSAVARRPSPSLAPSRDASPFARRMPSSATRCPSPHHEHGTGRVVDDLVGRRTEEPSPDGRVAAVADHEQVCAHLHGVVGEGLRRVSRTDLAVHDQPRAGDLPHRLVLDLLEELLRGPLLVVHLVDRARIAGQLLDRDEEELGLARARQVDRGLQGLARALRAVESHRDTPVHAFLPCPGDSATARASFTAGDCALTSGWKNACAINVGTTALPMTTVTRTVYCVRSMRWCSRPKRAEMVPKVRPVAIMSVV